MAPGGNERASTAPSTLGTLADALAAMSVGDFSRPLAPPVEETDETDETILELWVAAELLRQDLEEAARLNAEAALRSDAYAGFLAQIASAGDNAQGVVDSVSALVDCGFVGLCSVLLLAEDDRYFDLAGVFHKDAEFRNRVRSILDEQHYRTDEGIAGRAFGGDSEVFVPQVDRQVLNDQIPERVRVLTELYPIGSLAVVPIRRGDGTRGVVGMYNDTDMRRFTNEDLRVFTNVAERIGIALDRAEQHEQLRRMEQALAAGNAELARSNKDLEEFAFAASHDLQEPLRVVVSFTELLARRNPDLDEKSMDFMRRAQNAAVRMRALIDDLLAYSRVGREERRFDCVRTGDVVAEAIDSLSTVIRETGASVVVGDLPDVRGDATLLRQLFQNLIGNAIKYAGDDPPLVEITAGRDADPHFWQFAVRDNGIGIEPRFADRIFVVFQRLHARDRYSGTGIGLAICKRVVERHGGRIWVESEPGVGSTFRLTLEGAQ